MAEQKKQAATNGEFKTAPLGFDKNEVMAYIVQHNKVRKALQEENEQLKKALEEKQHEKNNEDLQKELEAKKHELDAQIIESRKQILDERRKHAQIEKELMVLQDKYKALSDDYSAYKSNTAKKLAKAKTASATIDEAQLAELSAKASNDANAIIADAQNKAAQIITAAKAYFSDTVNKAYDYKQFVLEKADKLVEDVKAQPAASPAIDVSKLLEELSAQINEAVSAAVRTAADNAASVQPEEPAEAVLLSDDEEIAEAKSELERIAGFDASELAQYEPMTVEPYSFTLNVVAPAPAARQDDDEQDEEDLFVMPDNGLLSSVASVSSDDMSVVADVSASDDILTEGDFTELVEQEPVAVEITDVDDLVMETVSAQPGAANTDSADNDFADLMADDEPEPIAEPVAEYAEDDDFSSLIADNEPAVEAVAEEPAASASDDDFSDLLDTAPDVAAPAEAKDERPRNRNKEKLNESRSMGVAGKDPLPNDPWRDLELQMNDISDSMPAPAPKAKKPVDDDGMTSSFDDEPVQISDKPAKDEKIDMSDYSSMLGGMNDNINTNNAQYDPSWDMKMLEGVGDDKEDDEMSSETGGFFDL